MIEALNSRPVLSNTLATCGNFNINSLQLNNIKILASQSLRPHFKCSKVTCGYGYHIGRAYIEYLHFYRKFYCTALLRLRLVLALENSRKQGSLKSPAP